MREHWSVESWHWIRDTQLGEDADHYRSNGAGLMATLRTAALNLLRLAGFHSIREGLQAEIHDFTALVSIAIREPEQNRTHDLESALNSRQLLLISPAHSRMSDQACVRAAACPDS